MYTHKTLTQIENFSNQSVEMNVDDMGLSESNKLLVIDFLIVIFKQYIHSIFCMQAIQTVLHHLVLLVGSLCGETQQ